MLTTLVVASLAIILFLYIAIPLLMPSQADPLPDMRDPLEEDLEEERDALFRAIRELEMRDDLPQARRDELRARYEGKAAKVLRALDERQATLRGQTAPVNIPRSKRPPYAILTLLVLMMTSGSVLGGYVLPRVGSGTLTTFDERDIALGRELQRLQRAVQDDPSPTNLLNLADTLWAAGSFAEAASAYERYAGVSDNLPLRAYQRLGLILAQQDELERALPYLEAARSFDAGHADTLFLLGEAYFAQGRIDEAVNAWEALLQTPEAVAFPELAAWLENIKVIQPLMTQAQADPSEANLLALADTYWNFQQYDAAMSIYFQVLTQHNPQHPRATSRIGQTLFFAGRFDDAAGVLERAYSVDPEDLPTLLFLGNSYYSLGRLEDAIITWESYVTVAGGAERAGRVPTLIADARAELGGGVATAEEAGETLELATAPAEEAVVVAVSGHDLYSRNCASCHGAAGQGGAGPRLVNNARVTDRERVLRFIRDGRGMMPAYGMILSEEELQALTDYVTTTVQSGEASR